ncbi:glycosyltransferase family 2 protein [Campylobacter sp. RM16192]|uniref:glycosyltransferase family 2 protein n=1 Tax=Campylobacter sp. RM16192 TaxID=1660080 RepID=UPI0014524229|nr:glycosyltransferase family 2 protein [Campylobacter sp. RM16192]QCD53351.1 glycosyltransferase, family 2 [Campylobacter sp. RM16192]
MIVKVSFVVPAYNVSKYIKDCVQSIIDQSLKEIEIIVVNDGSTDNTLEILNSFQDERLKIVTKPNGGLTSARNAGIKLAKGEYIINVDGDDFVHLNYAKIAYEKAKDTMADIVVVDFYKQYKDRNEELHDLSFIKNEIVDKDLYLNALVSNFAFNAIWNKLIKAEILKQTLFLESIFYAEDLNALAKIIFNSKKIVKINKCLYFYRWGENNGSEINRFKYIIDYDLAIKDLIDFFRKNMPNNDDIIKKLQKMAFDRTYMHTIFSFLHADYEKKVYQDAIILLRNGCDNASLNSNIFKTKFKYKFCFWLIKNIKSDKNLCSALHIFMKINNFFSRKKIKELKQ